MKLAASDVLRAGSSYDIPHTLDGSDGVDMSMLAMSAKGASMLPLELPCDFVNSKDMRSVSSLGEAYDARILGEGAMSATGSTVKILTAVIIQIGSSAHSDDSGSTRHSLPDK